MRITSRVTASFVTDARECRWAYSCIRQKGRIDPEEDRGASVCTEAAVAVFSPVAINMPL